MELIVAESVAQADILWACDMDPVVVRYGENEVYVATNDSEVIKRILENGKFDRVLPIRLGQKFVFTKLSLGQIVEMLLDPIIR